MNIEQTIEAIRVMQAFVDGKEVEFKILVKPECLTNNEWKTIAQPAWDFNCYTYRIKPTATLRPWTADEVPLGAWIRRKDALRDGRRVLISETYDESVRSTWRVTSEHSTDGGKTWLPCGVMEESK
jgi:hypothetical protein